MHNSVEVFELAHGVALAITRGDSSFKYRIRDWNTRQNIAFGELKITPQEWLSSRMVALLVIDKFRNASLELSEDGADWRRKNIGTLSRASKRIQEGGNRLPSLEELPSWGQHLVFHTAFGLYEDLEAWWKQEDNGTIRIFSHGFVYVMREGGDRVY